MIDSFWRQPYHRRFVAPFVPMLIDAGATPNMLTALALITGIATVPAIAIGYPTVAFLLLFMSGYLDTLDGSVARAADCKSRSGAVFDIISDRAVEFSVIVALYTADQESRALLCLLMLGSVLLCITSFLVVGIFIENEGEKSFYYHPGLMERTEAFFFFGAMILIPDLFTLLAVLFITLVMATALMRVHQFTKRQSIRE